MINVLIVDDSAVVRSLVENVMKEDARFHILGFAENGAAAVEQNRKLAPDLIVMDITMPIMNGIEASKKILETSSPAIVAFTTEDSEETAFKCYEANIIEIITKPNFSTMNKTMIENLCDKLAIIAQEHKQRQIRKKKRNDLLEKRRKETQEAELAESQKKRRRQDPCSTR